MTKTIHCCWLSKEPKTELAERCRDSWRRFAPDWKIREWTIDEVRMAADKGEIPTPPPFFEEAVQRGKWAFAADWVRFAALASEGGIYLDYDVELLTPLPELGEFVAGQWMPDGSVGMEPAVLAMDRGNSAANAMVSFYARAPLDTSRTTGEILREVLRSGGIGIKVLPPEVFCPIGIDGVARTSKQTVGVHHYAMSWAPASRKLARWLSWHGMRWLVDALLDMKHVLWDCGWVWRVAVCAVGVLALSSVVQGFRNAMQCVDFHWESAALFLRRENPYKWFFDNRFYDGVVVDATQAPSTIAFILPFGILPHNVANTLWAVCNLAFSASFLFCVARLFLGNARGRYFADPRVWIFAALFLCGAPWRVGLGCGQHTMFSLAFFAAALLAVEQKRHWLIVGVLISAALFKYTVTVPLAFIFVMRRQWKALAVAAAIHAALTVAMGLWTNTNPLELVRQSMEVGVALNPSGGDADLAGLAKWFGVDDVWPFAMTGYAVFGLAIIGYSTWRAFRPPQDARDSLVDLSVLAILADMAFYHRCYDLISLAFPLLLCLTRPFGIRTLLPLLLVVNAFFLLRVDFALDLGFYKPMGFVLHVLTLLTLVTTKRRANGAI